MARFTVGKPIATRTPSIEVDAGLEVGRHRFQLEVVTADGRRSKPDVAVVEVVEGRIFRPPGRDDLLDRPILRPDGPIVTGPIPPPITE